MLYTLGQAAKATGKSKPTIQRAIKSGIMSADRAEDGSYKIDPSELHRVFPPVTAGGNEEQGLKQSVPPVPPSDTAALQREIALLRERIADKERVILDKDGVIDDLRERLDTEGEERRRTQTQLTALLTDQRPRRKWWQIGKRSAEG